MTDEAVSIPLSTLDSMIERLRGSEEPRRPSTGQRNADVVSVIAQLLDRTVTGNALAVYLALRYLSPNGGFQGHQALASRAGLDAVATVDAIIELTREGLLKMHEDGWSIAPATRKETP